MNKNTVLIKGSCHCGSVCWEFSEPLESVTACNCTLCRRYGALWAYSQLNDGVTISGETRTYSRGSKINGYHFCAQCGCMAYYLAFKADNAGKYRIAVNVRLAEDPVQIMDLPIDHFDGFEKFEDLLAIIEK